MKDMENILQKKKLIGDALITDQKKVIIGVLTADCVPILIYDKKNNIIGCIHAGWKGAFGGIIENTISKIKKLTGKVKDGSEIKPTSMQRPASHTVEFGDKFHWYSQS